MEQPLRRPSVVALLSVALAGSLSACGGNTAAASASATAPPPKSVWVIELKPQSVHLSSQWIATLDGLVNAQIRPQVSGYLVRAAYREGATVNKGDVLFEIDPRTFEAAVAQAEAQLGQAKAQLGRTELDVARDKPMAAERAIAQSQLDNDIQLNLAAAAAVQVAEAQVATARLNLEFTKVRSLVTGVAAIATAQIGDLVSPATLLTTVSQVDPIRAFFSLNEQEYLQVAAQINARVFNKSLWGNGTALNLTLADGTLYPQKGTFLAADRQIDPKTGTIRLSATFPNPDHQLRPGQYGRVSAETKSEREALLVPLRAVSELQGTFQVRVVRPDDTVEIRTVVLGDRLGSNWIAESGLHAGEKIVIDSGQVAADTKVTTKPWVPPAAPAAAQTTTSPSTSGR